MNPWIFCCLLLSGANQLPERALTPNEFPPDIILPAEPVENDLLLWVPKDRDRKNSDREVSTDPFVLSPSLLNPHETDDHVR